MSVSIDQGLKVYFPHSRYILNPKLSYGFAIVRLNFILKKINYIKTPKSFKAAMIILFGINVHILLFVGKVSYVKQNVTNNLNITEEVSIRTFDCYNSNFYELHPFWDRVHLIVYGFGPFLITILSNLLIIFKIFGVNSPLSGQRRKKKLAITILLISFTFIICALPQIISFGFFFVELSSTLVGIVILPLSDLINFTFNGFNFMIYFITNIVFRNECIFQINSFLNEIQLTYYKALSKIRCISAQELSEIELSHRTNRFYHRSRGRTTNTKS